NLTQAFCGWLTASLLMASCAPTDPEEFDPSHPKDHLLRMNHLQAVGTHNSYHQIPPGGADTFWDYDHLPLDQQLNDQGVRKFELDIYWDRDQGTFKVYHVPVVDHWTVCETLTLCLGQIQSWSEVHPGHHPLFIMIEPKESDLDEAGAALWIDHLEQRIDGVFDRAQVITPDEVQKDAASLRDQITKTGWPLLSEVRGRVLFWVNTGGVIRRVLDRDGQDLSGRLVFAETDLNSPVGSITNFNTPTADNLTQIQAAVSEGFIIRSRADADPMDVLAGAIEPRRRLALDSGAHLLSTDFPGDHPRTDYVFQMPDGSPSRCNPVNAPTDCLSSDIEDPSRLAPP
ncbi:MAG: Ca2+-dependent phosphoinositide-specific phospholipase C, partial [Myxococcota bacterium]|nr:Ca2+-dependent phosphoinositide-specific phospholipase C [Myxococcota bacterium]